MNRLSQLRSRMKQENIDCYLIPTGDHHGSEYVSAAFKGREYLSGFSGSAGTLIVREEEAGLWTDGRYFIQAKKELSVSKITLYRAGEPDVPTINEYLKDTLNPGQTLVFDGRLLSAKSGIKIADELAEKNINIIYDDHLLDSVWHDRPPITANPVWKLSIDWCGQSTPDKLKALRDKLIKNNKTSLLLNSLDDIMWLFNIRGSDIPRNPVSLSYAYISEDKALLFLQKGMLSEDVKIALTASLVEIKEYHDFYKWLSELDISSEEKILLDREKCNYFIYKVMEDKILKLRQQASDDNNKFPNAQSTDKSISDSLFGESPTKVLKAVKNETEIKHLYEVYRKDSAAVIRFIKWLKENKDPVSETEAADQIDRLRRETPGFIDLSFKTISAYGANAAMMHYQADKNSDTMIKKEGLYLVDSGGQYFGGTTDITRTIVMGEISDEIKCHFTAVVKGMLNLSKIIFLHGCTGRSLDIIARKPLWEIKSDYKCGTGHGIGYMLNVHEGPQSIRMPYREDSPEAVIEPGMLISNEPGVYKAGEYGIRIENIMLAKEIAQNDDGRFLAFDTLTLVPIDLDAIDIRQLSIEDKKQLNDYHRRVYEDMKDYLNEDERIWLKTATRDISPSIGDVDKPRLVSF